MTGKMRAWTPGRAHGLLMLALLLTTMALSAGVEVTRGRIAIGYNPRNQKYNWSQFSCSIKNTDKASRSVMVRVLTKDGTSQKNIFSGNVTAPAHSEFVYTIPVLLETSESFKLEVFVDNNKLPSSNMSDFEIKLVSGQEKLLGVLNDNNQYSLGAFTQYPDFKGKYMVSSLQCENVPQETVLYSQFRYVLLLYPDFSKYSTAQFNALLDYVSNGGTLIFGSPEVAMEAVQTPLEVLLPVTPVGIRETESLPELRGFLPGLKDIAGKLTVLDSVEKGPGVNLLTHNGMPLIREKRFGLGTVKLIAAAPTENNFKDNNQQSILLKYLMAGQTIQPDESIFTETLDKLTGFPVPKVERIRNLILIYLALITVIIAAGTLARHAEWAWLGAAAAALVMTGHVLHLANTSVGSKGSLLAEMMLYNESPSALQKSYLSFFADSAKELDLRGQNKLARFTAIPEGAGLRLPGLGSAQQFGSDPYSPKKSGALRNAAPLELRYGPDRIHQIHQINLAARSSKQFRYQTGSDTASGLRGGKYAEPELILTEEGLKLTPWTLPEDLRDMEAAFLMLANGAIMLRSEDGKLELASGEQLLQDTLSKSIRKAMEAGSSAEAPYVAVIAPLKDGKASLKLEEGIQAQGKRVVMIPAKLKINAKKIRIPAQMVGFSAADSASRVFMRGSKIAHEMPSQSGFNATFELTLPSYLLWVKPEKMTVKYEFVSADNNVDLEPKLLLELPGSQRNQETKGFKGKSIGKNEYEFSAKELKEAYSSATGSMLLQLESKDRPGLTSSDRQDYRGSTWQLHSVDVEIEAAGDGRTIEI